MAYVRGDRNKPIIEKFVPSAGWTEDSNGHQLLVDLPEFKKEQVRIQVNKSTGHVMVSGERTTNQNKHVRFEQIYKIPAQNSDLDKVTAKFDGEMLYVTVPKQVVEKKQDETTIITTSTSTTTTIEKKNVVNGGDAEEKAQQKPHEEVKKSTDDEESHGDKGHGCESKKEEKLDDKGHGCESKKEEKLDDKGHGCESKKEEKLDDKGHGCESKKEEKLDGNSSGIRFAEDSVEKWEDGEGGLRSAMKMLRQNRGIILTALLAFSLGVLLSRRFQPAGH